MNNNESTCCQNDVCERDNAVATRPETIALAEPVWAARRHEQGVDLEVTLPGVRKEDLSLEVVGRDLQLQATRNTPADRGRLVHGQPAPDGYRLKLRLADSLDGSKLSATLTDGVLKVGIPLTEAAQPRRVAIA